MDVMSRAFSFISLLGVAYLVNLVSPLDFRVFGLIPRDPWGLLGIPLMPFLHRDVEHLVHNSVGIFVLLSVLYSCIKDPDRVSLACLRIILVSGFLLWIFGRGTSPDGKVLVHIGASALVYGLVTFSLMNSIWCKNLPLFLASVFILAYTGLSLVGGILPFDPTLSWDGHLAGALAGCVAASIDHKDTERTFCEKVETES
jgi:membrane associated rhomboid family serine protease